MPGPEPGPMPVPRPGPEPWPMPSLPRPRPTPLPPPCQLYPVLLEASCQQFHVPEPGPAPLPSLLEDLSCQPFLSPWPDQLCDSSVPCGPSSSHALPSCCHLDTARPRDTQCVLPRPCQNGLCPIMHKSLLSLLHTSAHILLLPCTLCLLLNVAIHGLGFMQILGLLDMIRSEPLFQYSPFESNGSACHAVYLWSAPVTAGTVQNADCRMWDRQHCYTRSCLICACASWSLG